MLSHLHMVSTNERPVMNYVPEIVIIPTTDDHIRELQTTIRAADKKEIEDYGTSCNKGLWLNYKRGLMNKTALFDGKVAAIWGCGGTYMGNEGAPWLITSHEITKISPLRFARVYQKEVYQMLKLFSYLVNYVASDYDEAIRLLSIVGFTIGEPEKLGNGIFRKFEMRAKT